MSHDAPAPAPAPAPPATADAHEAHYDAAAVQAAHTADEHTPALQDAKKVLLIVLAGIAAWAAVVSLFVF